MHDIFKKTPKKEKKKKIPSEKVLVDFREKNSLVPSEMIKKGLNIEFCELKVGDYIVKDIVIERKSREDFFNSIFDKRIFTQLANMSEYENRMILLEGDYEKNLPIHENALKGIFLSIGLKYKTPIVFSKNEEDTAKIIFLLSTKKEKSNSLTLKKKPTSDDKKAHSIIEAFPGIGPAISKKLFDKFGSVKNIIDADEEKLSKILGKKFHEFKKILNLKVGTKKLIKKKKIQSNQK